MKLSREEQDMLEGKHGKAKQKAIEKLIDFGKAVEAESMVPIVGSHIFPSIAAEEASEYDFGAYPIYQYFSSLDAKVKILTTT
jgi:predicted aconitase